MKNKNSLKLKTLLATLVLFSVSGIAKTELTEIQLQAISDQAEMSKMSMQEKRTFRKKVFSQYDNQEQQVAYNRAFKKTTSKGLSQANSIDMGSIANRNPGTSIVYDTFATTGVTAGTLAGRGNLFDLAFKSGNGIVPVETSGTITGVVIAVNPLTAATNTAWVQVVTDLAGTTPAIINSRGFGLPTNTMAAGYSLDYSGTMTVMHANGPFIVGFTAGSVHIAFDSNSVNTQGFHAVEYNTMNFSSASGIVPIAGLNAIIRVNGDVLTPVELMNFSIE